MRYIMRITAMIVGVILGSAVLASFLSEFLVTSAAVSGLDSGGVFVGLVTMGFMGAILSREAWLTA